MPTLRQFIQSQVHALPQSTMDNKDKFIRRLISVEITWNYGGNSVGVVGSWNNWQNMEFLQHTETNVTVTMALPVGIHYYCFIVDGALTYASNLECVRDNYGDHYNILYLQEDVLKAPGNGFANLSEFESPPSPPSSYDNKFFTDKDFYYRTKEGKVREIQPPELPPQLAEAVLDMPSCSSDAYHSLPRPQFSQSQSNHRTGTLIHPFAKPMAKITKGVDMPNMMM
uniref:AMP-activated protein kinase glycogen-binding domain-containing protein n=1 Tax=Fagus sylvatica TaxID=28930 RepID=A0A2N9GSQ1_FAGSY